MLSLAPQVVNRNDLTTIEEGNVPQAYPWNSVKEFHYHNNTKCGPGSEIPPHNRQSGTGGKPLCRDCAKLNNEGK